MEMLIEYPTVQGTGDGMTVHLLGTMANKKQNPHCIRGKDATLRRRAFGLPLGPAAFDPARRPGLNDGGEIAALSLSEVAQAISRRAISSREATQACLARIERFGETLHCIARIDPEAALRAF